MGNKKILLLKLDNVFYRINPTSLNKNKLEIKLPNIYKSHKKYEDDNIIRLCRISIILPFMADIYFTAVIISCLMRDVLLLLTTILYE